MKKTTEEKQFSIPVIGRRFIVLEGCPKYLSKGVKWVKTNAKCRRDNEIIWQEQSASGELLNIFGCSRSGCSWTDYLSNTLDIIEQLKDYKPLNVWKK